MLVANEPIHQSNQSNHPLFISVFPNQRACYHPSTTAVVSKPIPRCMSERADGRRLSFSALLGDAGRYFRPPLAGAVAAAAALFSLIQQMPMTSSGARVVVVVVVSVVIRRMGRDAFLWGRGGRGRRFFSPPCRAALCRPFVPFSSVGRPYWQ